jgi:hypothetical protein
MHGEVFYRRSGPGHSCFHRAWEDRSGPSLVTDGGALPGEWREDGATEERICGRVGEAESSVAHRFDKQRERYIRIGGEEWM